jgi:uncharacterized protein (TIGR04222 family)
MVLAAQGDTWGIHGPTFLVYYIAALAAVVFLASMHRRVLFRGDRNAHVEVLGPQQVAYLNGGDRLAVYAALGGLRGAGVIGSGPGKTLSQAGPMPAGLTPLDTAIYNAAGRGIRVRDLEADQWVQSALQQLRYRLEANGLAVSKETMRTVRLWALAGAAVTLVGIARLIAGLGNNKPVGVLIPVVAIAAILTISMIKKTRYATRAAQQGLIPLRRQYDYLSPSQSPSYATYGATGAAMGVALFGTASLFTMDPAFAAETEMQRINSTGGAGHDAGGSSGGGSCSGGSSCGGGGGCGGGGCGG